MYQKLSDIMNRITIGTVTCLLIGFVAGCFYFQLKKQGPTQSGEHITQQKDRHVVSGDKSENCDLNKECREIGSSGKIQIRFFTTGNVDCDPERITVTTNGGSLSNKRRPDEGTFIATADDPDMTITGENCCGKKTITISDGQCEEKEDDDDDGGTGVLCSLDLSKRCAGFSGLVRLKAETKGPLPEDCSEEEAEITMKEVVSGKTIGSGKSPLVRRVNDARTKKITAENCCGKDSVVIEKGECSKTPSCSVEISTSKDFVCEGESYKVTAQINGEGNFKNCKILIVEENVPGGRRGRGSRNNTWGPFNGPRAEVTINNATIPNKLYRATVFGGKNCNCPTATPKTIDIGTAGDCKSITDKDIRKTVDKIKQIKNKWDPVGFGISDLLPVDSVNLNGINFGVFSCKCCILEANLKFARVSGPLTMSVTKEPSISLGKVSKEDPKKTDPQGETFDINIKPPEVGIELTLDVSVDVNGEFEKGCGEDELCFSIGADDFDGDLTGVAKVQLPNLSMRLSENSAKKIVNTLDFSEEEQEDEKEEDGLKEKIIKELTDKEVSFSLVDPDLDLAEAVGGVNGAFSFNGCGTSGDFKGFFCAKPIIAKSNSVPFKIPGTFEVDIPGFGTKTFNFNFLKKGIEGDTFWLLPEGEAVLWEGNCNGS